jgi:hypothetical protein
MQLCRRPDRNAKECGFWYVIACGKGYVRDLRDVMAYTKMVILLLLSRLCGYFIDHFFARKKYRAD